MRTMLFYVDEFPELLHHPIESHLLFLRVARLAPSSTSAKKSLFRGVTAPAATLGSLEATGL
jgi:hemerythrin-like domain-containing protein